jgi:translation initiation factor IF-3
MVLQANCSFLPLLKPKTNNEITAREVRVLDETKQNLGVMQRDEALALAASKGVDLIEVVGEAVPPVVRLMSYDKYRYEREKAMKKERREQKGADLKQVQISARAAENDLRIRLKKLEEFLAEGHPVEINLRLRGREKYMKDWARERMMSFLRMIETEHRVIDPPKFAGRGMSAQIVKK